MKYSRNVRSLHKDNCQSWSIDSIPFYIKKKTNRKSYPSWLFFLSNEAGDSLSDAGREAPRKMISFSIPPKKPKQTNKKRQPKGDKNLLGGAADKRIPIVKENWWESVSVSVRVSEFMWKGSCGGCGGDNFSPNLSICVRRNSIHRLLIHNDFILFDWNDQGRKIYVTEEPHTDLTRNTPPM